LWAGCSRRIIFTHLQLEQRMPFLSHRLTAVTAATVCAFSAGFAQAESYTLELAGDAANLTTDSFVSGANQVSLSSLVLDGFLAPIDLEQGDMLSATVTILGGPLVVPASPFQFFGFEVRGPDDPQFDTSPGAKSVWAVTVSFFLGAVLVDSSASGCSNCSFAAVFRTPGASFSFDRIQVEGTFENLTSPYTISSAEFRYQLSQPVPEPATWAMWLAGLGLAGAAARRRVAMPRA